MNRSCVARSKKDHTGNCLAFSTRWNHPKIQGFSKDVFDTFVVGKEDDLADAGPEILAEDPTYYENHIPARILGFHNIAAAAAIINVADTTKRKRLDLAYLTARSTQ